MEITSFLSKYKDKNIIYKANAGNAGDALIAYATLQVFHNCELQYTLYKEGMDLEGKIVFFGGGGNLVKEYASGAKFISSCKDIVAELIILPHTITGHTDLLRSLKPNVTIFCRENMSFEYLKSLGLMPTIYLADDMALSLDVSVMNLKTKAPLRFINYLNKYVVKRTYVLFKSRIFNPLFWLKKRKTDSLDAFRLDKEKTTVKIPEGNIDLSILFMYEPAMDDESSISNSVTDFISFLNQFKTVNTNRLHVGIGAALLGKNVKFYSNSYYKNQAVFDFSLKDRFPNIVWMK